MPEPSYPEDNSNLPEQGAAGQKPQAPRRAALKKVILIAVLLLVLVAGAVTTAVYWNGEKKNAETRAAQTEVVNIYITAEGFTPANVQIKPGTQIVWTNKDTIQHEVKVTDKNAVSLDMSEQLATGESYSVILDEEKDYYVQSPINGAQLYQGVIKVSNKVDGNE